ncbi:MAG: acyltransferase family protein, partial [Oscillospiraceae bacterium]|nr:acyltransferase family protein [Oscillospiraceae bacterium]
SRAEQSRAEQSRAEQSRDYHIDFLKVLACIAVVGLHTFQKDLSVFNSTLYYLCGFAIPAFWMASGAFLINRKSVTWEYVFRKIGKILRIVIIWNILIIGAQLIAKFLLRTEYEFEILTIPKEIVKSLLQKGTLWQFWYFGALIILYLLLPLIIRLTERQRRVLFFVAGIIAVGLQIYSLIQGSPVQKNVIQTFRLWTWLFYFIGGGLAFRYIRNRKVEKTGQLTFAILIVTIFVLVYQNLIGRFVLTESTGILHAEYFYDSVFTMAWTFLLFGWINSIRIKNNVKKWTVRLAPLTMGIYIVHPLVIRVYQHFITVETIQGSITFFAMVLFSAAILAGVIYKIPVAKRLINL